MVADTKKVQTMVNICAQQIQDIRAAVARIVQIRDVFTTVNPSVVGTALEENVMTVNQAINALKAETDKAVWAQLIAAIVPSHRNKALEV